MRVESIKEVDIVADLLKSEGIDASTPKLFPEYAPDYYATFFTDPDGIELEITNYRSERKERYNNWQE